MKNWNKTISMSFAVIVTFIFLSLPLSCGAEQAGPVVTVAVTPITMGTISQSIVTYGTIIPAPGATEELSVPYESQVLKVLVRPGQPVSAGDPLVEISPSPDTRLKFQVAKAAYETAQKRFDDVERKKRLKLATNDEVLQARQALVESDLALKSFEAMGAMDQTILKASHKGVLSEIFEQEGAIVTPGGPLVKIVAGGALECLLGAESEDAALFKPGQAVSISPVNRPGVPPITGRIRAVSRSIDPTTRLVDIFVVPGDPDGLLLNEYVRGGITVNTAEGLIVPRSAVLKTGDRFFIFTVKDDRATKHFIQPGIQNTHKVQFLGQDLHVGDQAVILGNYELEDGMTVKVEESK